MRQWLGETWETVKTILFVGGETFQGEGVQAGCQQMVGVGGFKDGWTDVRQRRQKASGQDRDDRRFCGKEDTGIFIYGNLGFGHVLVHDEDIVGSGKLEFL